MRARVAESILNQSIQAIEIEDSDPRVSELEQPGKRATGARRFGTRCRRSQIRQLGTW
jgi:hypothetical protein